MRELIVDALDGQLSPEQEAQLRKQLERDPQAALDFDAQQQIDSMLHRPPQERAPERLAETILARLAMVVQQQAQMNASPEMTEATMQVALALVTAATLPLVVGAAYLLLNARANPEALEAVLAQVASFFMLVIDIMKVMIAEAQAAFKTDPEAALALLTLIPLTLLALVKQIFGDDDDAEEGE
jgi:anti-sigma factor RsiW